MLEIGKLYKSSRYYLLIYPTKGKAEAAAATAAAAARRAAVAAVANTEYWSERLNCQVRYSEPGEIFVIVQKDGDFALVLFGEKLGWIWLRDWIKIEPCSK